MAAQTSWASEALAVNPNSAADRRLRNEWLFGRASHMFSLGHFAKILQLLQFHRVLLTKHSLRGAHRSDEFILLDATHRGSYREIGRGGS